MGCGLCRSSGSEAKRHSSATLKGSAKTGATRMGPPNPQEHIVLLQASALGPYGSKAEAERDLNVVHKIPEPNKHNKGAEIHFVRIKSQLVLAIHEGGKWAVKMQDTEGGALIGQLGLEEVGPAKDIEAQTMAYCGQIFEGPPLHMTLILDVFKTTQEAQHKLDQLVATDPDHWIGEFIVRTRPGQLYVLTNQGAGFHRHAPKRVSDSISLQKIRIGRKNIKLPHAPVARFRPPSPLFSEPLERKRDDRF